MAPVEREDTLDRAISRFDDAVNKFREVGSALAAAEGELCTYQCSADLAACVVTESLTGPARPGALFGGYGSRCGVWVQGRPIITSPQHNR